MLYTLDYGMVTVWWYLVPVPAAGGTGTGIGMVLTTIWYVLVPEYHTIPAAMYELCMIL